MLSVAYGTGWIIGFKIHNNIHNTLEISHLLYVNDILVMCDAEVDQLKHLRVDSSGL